MVEDNGGAGSGGTTEAALSVREGAQRGVLRGKGWTVTWNGETWSEDDLTVAHVADIIRSRGDASFGVLNPFQDAIAPIYILAAFLADDKVDILQVLSALRAVPYRQVLDSYDVA